MYCQTRQLQNSSAIFASGKITPLAILLAGDLLHVRCKVHHHVAQNHTVAACYMQD